MNFLKNYLDALLPKTLNEKFLKHEGQIKRRQKKEKILELTGKTSIENTK